MEQQVKEEEIVSNTIDTSKEINNSPSKKQNPPPKTEVELQRLQEEYLKPDCPQRIRDEYFMLLRTYARSIALGTIKRKQIFLVPERVDEIATDATMATLSQYQKEGWKVRGSFAGQLIYKVIEAMYKSKNVEQELSLNNTISADSNNKEMIDLVSNSSEGTCFPWLMNKDIDSISNPISNVISDINVSSNEIQGIINEAYNSLPYSTFMRFLPWLCLRIRKPKTRNLYSLYDRLFLDGREETAFEILLLEVRNRILERVKEHENHQEH